MFKTTANPVSKTLKGLVTLFTVGTLFLATTVKAEEDTPLILESATNPSTPAISIDAPGMLKLDATPEFNSVKSDWQRPNGGVRLTNMDDFLISISEQNRPLASSPDSAAAHTAMNFDMDYPEVSDQNLLNSNFAKTLVRKLTGTK